MAADHVAEKRARLRSARARWSGTEETNSPQTLPRHTADSGNQDSIQQWLISIAEENAKPEVQEAPVQILQRNASSEDDLALGVEASLYGKQAVRSTRAFQRSSLPRPPLSRWSSLASAFSTQSGPLSVMDVLNLWQDDPEELLLDLGFGAEEPDITVKIPARFINHQSNARGINIQLFLEAQKNRMDIENPDVSNRFRQLEVLQQVTTAFNSLVGGSAQTADKPAEPPISMETRERRKRVGMLLRKASRKTLSQAPVSQTDQPPPSPPLAPPPSPAPELLGDPAPDKRGSVKRARQCLPESASLSPLMEEQSSISEASRPTEPGVAPSQRCASLKGAAEPQICTSSLSTTAHRRPGEPAESFEMEEIQSFDEGSVAGSYAGTTDHTGSERVSLSRVSSSMVRTNSCQSDSSGFLEELTIPAFSQHPGPGPELMKVLNAMSGESSDSQQKSVDLQEKDFHLLDSLNSEMEDEHSHSGVINPNNDLVRGKTHSEQMFSGGDAAENLLQGNDQVDCMNVGQKDTDAAGEGPMLQGKSPSPRPDVIPESDYQVEVPKSDARLYGTESSPMADEPHTTGNEVASTPECDKGNGSGLYSGRLVSVQMLSSLASVSQSSPRGSSLEFGSPNAGQLSRQTSSHGTQEPDCSSAVSEPALFEVGAPARHLRHPQEGWEAGVSYEEDGRWENTLWAGNRCCCSCDHNCRCCCQNRDGQKRLSGSSVQLPSGPRLPFSLDELEGMMRCMSKFRRVLSEIEQRLQEEQESVLGSLSDSHREDVQDVLMLRSAVKHEAKKLEQQLGDLVHAYDDGIKTKMNRLLDEQSQLCAHLKIMPSDLPPRPGHTPTRSVAIQCSLLPVTDRPEPHLSQSVTPHGDWSCSGKADALGFVGFIKSLKDVSISNDSLE